MKGEQKKPRGRPAKAPEDTHTRRKEILLLDTELEAFSEASRLSGQSLSDWMRHRLRLAAEKELRKLDKPVPFLNLKTGSK